MKRSAFFGPKLSFLLFSQVNEIQNHFRIHKRTTTFVMNSEVILGQSNEVEFIFGTPRARKGCFNFGHIWIESSDLVWLITLNMCLIASHVFG